MDKLTQNSAKKLQGEQVSISTKEIIEMIFGKAKDKTEHNKFKQNIVRRAKKENWEFDKSINKNIGKFYFVHSLPEDIKQNYFSDIQKHTSTLPEKKNQPHSILNRERTYLSKEDNSKYDEPPTRFMQKTLIQTSLVLGLLDIEQSTERGKIKEAKERYAANIRMLPEYEETRKVLNRAPSLKSMERWKKKYVDANRDYRVLVPDYKARESQISEEDKKFLVKEYLTPNRRIKYEIGRDLIKHKKQLGETDIKCVETYVKFLKKFDSGNPDLVTFYRYGEKALFDNELPYFLRDRSKVKGGQIVEVDGHVMNMRVQDPLDGKMKRMMLITVVEFYSRYLLAWNFAPTENISSINTALFRAFLTLGKIPEVVIMDNGRAFKANHFLGDRGVYEKIGTKVIINRAYHSTGKAIAERTNKDIGEFERRTSSFTGTSIENKPAHLKRNEKLLGEIHAMVNLGNVDYFAVNNSFASFAEELNDRPMKILGGKSRREVFETIKGPGINKLELLSLMMFEENKKIRRGCIRLFNEEYESNHFYGIDKTLTVKYDLLDLRANGTVYCFDSRTGKFICTATRKNMLHPAAGILGTSEDVKQLQAQIKNRETLKAFTVKSSKYFLISEINPTVKKQVAVAEMQREKNEFEEMKKTGTDDYFEILSVKPIRSKKEKTRSWI